MRSLHLCAHRNSLLARRKAGPRRAQLGTCVARLKRSTIGGDDAPCKMPVLATTVTLTDTEQRLFHTLLETCRTAGLKTTLRCAGGWVRDKLIGRDSPDIDVALDDMYGKDFAERVNEYLQAHGEEARQVAVIHSNPEQSKHLETARMKVHGAWVDLVNLRSETYAQGSRIPTTEFGTPEQDAYRRDFTINSLFYNLNTGDIEDFTGRGLQDMRDGLIRTPLPPMETFQDDPLRVLRAIRFAARFQFEMDPEIEAAASSELVREALAHKVSRERVGTEVEGMFGAASPLHAIRYIQRFRLFPAVFEGPPEVQALLGEQYGAPCLQTLEAATKLLAAWHPKEPPLSPDERRMCLLAALLLPLRRASVRIKKKDSSVSGLIIREGLKWRVKDSQQTELLHCVAPKMLDVHARLLSLGGDGTAKLEGAPEDLRVALGMAIRKAGPMWRIAVLLGTLIPLPCATPLAVDAAEKGSSPNGAAAATNGTAAGGHDVADGSAAGSGADSGAELTATVEWQVEACCTLEAAAHAFGLASCHEWKPLLDGKRIMAEVGAQGKRVGLLSTAVMRWQLAHPDGSADECLAWLKDNHQSIE